MSAICVVGLVKMFGPAKSVASQKDSTNSCEVWVFVTAMDLVRVTALLGEVTNAYDMIRIWTSICWRVRPFTLKTSLNIYVKSLGE